MRRFVAAVILGLSFSAAAAENLERKICGFWEGTAFWMWRRVAERHHPKTEPQTAIPYSMRTIDGRTLHGYKLASISPNANTATIIIQGNAMTAATVVPSLEPFRKNSDVFVLDFRGYVKSEGASRFAALLNDYRQLLTNLKASGYTKVFVYGASLGGVIASTLLKAGADAIVIDSAPASLGDYGCPSSLDPVNQMPSNCSNVMVIAGARDPVIKFKQIKPLLERVDQCKGHLVASDQWSHPFMDYKFLALNRFVEARNFFLQQGQ